PQRLLSHPQGSALAVLGHVDRAWGYSIQPSDLGPQIQPFRSALGRILAGDPVGLATQDFSEKYAMLSAALLSALAPSEAAEAPGELQLVVDWIERNDAQSYV